MNKAELISKIAVESKLTKKASELSLNSIVNTISAELKKGGKVQLVGFGTFETRKREARVGINPQTKAKIKIPACKAPAFKAGKALKELVNKK